METIPSLSDLVQRVLTLRGRGEGRVLVGVVGEPGAGKSTLAAAVTEALTVQGVSCALVPMDGFHLSNGTLARRGTAERKGALDTFDGDGYVALLRRLRALAPPEVIHAPAYDRTIEESVAGAIEIGAGVQVVVTEGNYLLMTHAPWAAVAGLLDEVWFVTVDPDLRRERLLARHVRFGKEPEKAAAWVLEVDEPNAAQIRAGAERADLVVELS